MFNDFLDIFFLFFHSLLILFNLFGWLFKKTRRANFILLALTGLSWFGLGMFYGFGYCPLTDWHFNVLRKMDVEIHTHSYIQYLLQRIFSLKIEEELVDLITVFFYFLALIGSAYVNFIRGVIRRNAS